MGILCVLLGRGIIRKFVLVFPVWLRVRLRELRHHLREDGEATQGSGVRQGNIPAQTQNHKNTPQDTVRS